MSFLDKLKVKVEAGQAGKGDISDDEKKNTGFIQLSVDIYQTAENIVIVAPIPGVDVKDIDINIENDNDVVTIQGQRLMPRILRDMEGAGEEGSKYLRQECQWGQFYRQVILPQEVNVAEVEAKFTKGILILKLPLLRLQSVGKKKISVEKDK